MPRAGVTLEQVEMAAEKLVLQSDNPTIERVRRELGGTGSNSTIAKHLTAWRQQRAHPQQRNLPLLNSPPDPVHDAVNRVWQQMREESKVAIDRIKDTAEAQVVDAKLQLERSLQEQQQLAALLDKRQRDNNDLRTEINTTQQALRAEREQRIKLEAHLSSDKKATTQLRASLRDSDKQTRKLEKLVTTAQADNKQLKTQYKRETTERKAAQKQLLKLTGKVTGLELSLKQLKQTDTMKQSAKQPVV